MAHWIAQIALWNSYALSSGNPLQNRMFCSTCLRYAQIKVLIDVLFKERRLWVWLQMARKQLGGLFAICCAF